MLVAFFLVATYLGFVGIGSEFMDPPPKPVSVLSAPPARADIAVASGREEPPPRPPER